MSSPTHPILNGRRQACSDRNAALTDVVDVSWQMKTGSGLTSRLIAQYIAGKNIDPRTFSNVEGRISNNTQTVRKLPVKVGVSVVAQPS